MEKYLSITLKGRAKVYASVEQFKVKCNFMILFQFSGKSFFHYPSFYILNHEPFFEKLSPAA